MTWKQQQGGSWSWSRLNVGGTCDDGSRDPWTDPSCLRLRLRDARCEIGSAADVRYSTVRLSSMGTRHGNEYAMYILHAGYFLQLFSTPRAHVRRIELSMSQWQVLCFSNGPLMCTGVAMIMTNML